MKIAYSPCPNDTFIFHAWANQLIATAPSVHVTFADIDQTNQWAQNTNDMDVMKISFAALPYVLNDYRLLPCGGALGRGCGPLLLTRQAPSTSMANAVDDYDGSMLTGKRIAVPSELSTAYLLFRLWAAKHIPDGIGEIVVMPFHHIMPALQASDIDAGLVIHEARFTYQQYGLHQLLDLGQWWEATTGHPIPLGAIIAKRTIEAQPIITAIRASLEHAWHHPESSEAYVLQHAQEMDRDVAKAHIDLYVNDFSYDLGEQGFNAVEALLLTAMKLQLVPQFDQKLLYD
ncbi:1,4-dihydroxy-6-naphthoate synthase [Paenibacillus yanchengensis]|uniref:1,4-dihydroxy-6-naphtoate synthase n=1 Tax=Paenibacillus yanchengensis TaxID=2035833 RepID=A0ABW4YPP5_9BACL